MFIINLLTRDNKNKIIISPKINDKSVSMELDTGSALTLISQVKSIFDNVALSAPDSILKTYSREIIEQVGLKNMTVDYNGQTKNLKIHLVKNDGP